jgi:hypothetical protein
MPAAADRPPGRAEEEKHSADNKQDDPDRPQQRNLEDETEDQQDQTENQHREPLTSILGSELLADCERSYAVGLRGTAVQPSVDTALFPLL